MKFSRPAMAFYIVKIYFYQVKLSGSKGNEKKMLVYIKFYP